MLNASLRHILPTIQQQLQTFQPVNFTHFIKGSPTLEVGKDYHIGINYLYKNFMKLSIYGLGANFASQDGAYLPNVEIDHQTIYTTYSFHRATQQTYFFNAHIERYFKFMKSSIKLMPSYSTTLGKFFSQERLQNFKDLRYRLDVNVASGFKGNFNYILRNEFLWNRFSSTYVNHNFRHKTVLGLFYNTEKLNISTHFSRYDASFQKNVYLLDQSIQYRISDRMTGSFELRNAFDAQSFLTVSNQLNAWSQTAYEIQPRIGLIGIKYKF